MNSADTQLYSLSWGEFGSSLASTVQQLRGHGDLVDVTLAAGGRSFPAHKIVLSAASPFLLELLKSTPCQHPVVMLAGITADDLESLLEFIYKGEVSVEPENLSSLLQAAHCLNIHSLSPQTVVAEKSEENSVTVVNSEESCAMESGNYVNNRRRKRKRKTSTMMSKWPRSSYQSSVQDSRSFDDSVDDNRSIEFIRKDSHDANNSDVEGKDHFEHMNHHIIPPSPHQLVQPVTENFQEMVEDVESEPQLHDLMPMQPYSPLHIPQFPVSNPVSYTPSASVQNQQSNSSSTLAATPVSSQTTTKIRGASDCPGICPLCGATLRQARNLRRHLLSSCKYRFTANANNQSVDTVTIEVKPEDMSGYPEQTVESGGNSCEHIVCNPSPLPSPHGSNVVSPNSNISSPNVAR